MHGRHCGGGGWYEAIASEVLTKALHAAVAGYRTAAEEAASKVMLNERGIAPSTLESLDAWHDAVLRQEHAAELLERLRRGRLLYGASA